jgi:hypothetical protein
MEEEELVAERKSHASSVLPVSVEKEREPM